MIADLGAFGDDDGYGFTDPADEVVQPFLEDNWYEEQGDASGLDTFPESGPLTPPGPATEDGSSFATVVRRAAEVLDLRLPSDIKTSLWKGIKKAT